MTVVPGLQSDEEKEVQPSQAVGSNCSYCSKNFASRNALFRHLREDETCSFEHNGGKKLNDNDNVQMIKESMAFLFGYDDFQDDDVALDGTRNRQTAKPQPTVAEQAGERIRNVLVDSLRSQLSGDGTLSSSIEEIRIVSSTQSTLAKLRHRVLTQEAGCSATGDVLVVTVTIPSTTTIVVWEQVFETMKQTLSSDSESSATQLLACRLMDKGAAVPFHAERSCTQMIYHYLLPVSWIPDSDVISEWWREQDKISQHGNADKSIYRKYTKRGTTPSTNSLKSLKAALRAAESNRVRISTSEGVDTARMAKGRYGALGHKERRAWHSFASPALVGGAVSPNHETAWRVVDRARIIGFVQEESSESDEAKQLCAIIEVRGDDFLPQQVRRIVGSAVSIAHGWLPIEYFSQSTSSETVVETPLAPAGRLYLAGVRFHFDELEANGQPLFQNHPTRRIVGEWNVAEAFRANFKTQQRILRMKTNHREIRHELDWLAELKDSTCPRIWNAMDQQKNVIHDADAVPFPAHAAEELYLPVLTELRRIASNGEWPETSVARSNIIRGKENVDEKSNSGSFTIINPLVFPKDGVDPKANGRFPNLVEEVFRLERTLSEHSMNRLTLDGKELDVLSSRQPSSHCAVNCNAEFTPHVDSGVGKTPSQTIHGAYFYLLSHSFPLL